MDVMEIDAASNRGIDEIRELRETVKFAPAMGRYKVYIIDEVHMLTSEAFNALLKTLEEPPPNVVFILATTELQKVPATIQSRCQRYDFKRIATKDIEARLREVVEATGVEAEDAALALVAREADGGLRDALSTLDQCVSLAETRVTEALVREILGLIGRESVLKILRALAAKDAKEALAAAAAVFAEGKDAKQLVTEMIAQLRAAMVYQAAGVPEGVELYETDESVLKEMAALFPQDAFLPMLRRLHEALTELRWTTEPRIAVETAILAVCQSGGAAPSAQNEATPKEAGAPQATSQLRLLSARLEALEQKIASGAFSSAPGKTAAPSSGKTTRASSTMGVRRQNPAQPSAVNGSGDFVPTKEGEEIWRRVLEMVRQNPAQNVIYACVSKGTFGGMTEQRFCVRFQSEFLANRLDRPDYRNVIEGYIAEISGSARSLVVELGAPPAPQEKPKTAPPKKKTAAEMVAELPPEARAEVKKAIDIFGPDAKIVPVPEKSKPAQTQKKSEPIDEAPPVTDEDFEGLDDAYVPPEDHY
jgi:DNA polymerase-3 subunit gamma/tau